MAPVTPNAIRELNEVLDQQLSGQLTNTIVQGEAGGPKAAAELLNRLETSRVKGSMEHIRGIDATLAQKIEDNMFTFEDMKRLDDRTLQIILRDVEREKLSIAMKNASAEVRDRFFVNMSERAVKMLKEDLEGKGPLRLSEIESAQRDILSVAQKLDSEGVIILNNGGDDMVIE